MMKSSWGCWHCNNGTTVDDGRLEVNDAESEITLHLTCAACGKPFDRVYIVSRIENRGVLPGSKVFVVASVSSNANSFGLQGMVLVAEDGEAWEVGTNSLNVKTKGTRVTMGFTRPDEYDWAKLGFEIPKKLAVCPPNVVKEIMSARE